MFGNLPSYFNYVKNNFDLFLPDPAGLKVLQIGVYTGDLTLYLLERGVAEIWDVDTWEGSIEHEDLDFTDVEKFYNARCIDSRIRKHKMTSDKFFIENHFLDYFDFIYIDGDHSTAQVFKDGVNSWPRLRQGGLIAFDDYEWPKDLGPGHHPAPAIDLLMSIWRNEAEIVAKNYQVWLRKK